MAVPQPPRKPRSPLLAFALGVAVTGAMIWGGAGLLRSGDTAAFSSGPTTTTISSPSSSFSTTATSSSATTVVDRPAPIYRGTVAVIDEGDGPMVCIVVLDSLPPQCGGGVLLDGLDWSQVPWAETVQDVTWADMAIEVRFDQDLLSLVRPPSAPEPREGEEVDFTPPCPAPAGGWVWVDNPRTTNADFESALDYVRNQPDSAATWVYNLIEDPYEADLTGRQEVVLVALFTGDIDAHRAEIEKLWGGPLCVAEGRSKVAELQALQSELTGLVQRGSVPGVFGFGWSYVDERRGNVVLGAVLITSDAEHWLAEEYGQGLVSFESTLTPVD